MEEMLRGITTASAAASNPLLRSFLGPSASAAEYQEAAQYAEALWSHLDSLSQDPDAYRAFMSDTAAAARRDAEAARDPHVEGLSPALVLEAEATALEPPAGGGAGAGPGEGAAPAVEAEAGRLAAGLVRVVAGGQVVARVHIWAANDASGVKPPTLAGGAALPPPAPTSSSSTSASAPASGPPTCAGPSSWSGLTVPMAEYRPASVRPGGGGAVAVHVLHIAVHASAVRLVACSGWDPAAAAAFRAAFLEAVSQFAESEYRLRLSRSVRTLEVHREALGEAELRALLAADEAARARQAAKAATAAPDASVNETGLPPSLLQQLRSLGTAPQPAPKQPAPPQQPATAPAPDSKAQAKKPLIEELD